MSTPPLAPKADPINVSTDIRPAPPTALPGATDLPDDRGLAARQERPYHPERERERIRGWLAVGLAGMIPVVLLISWGAFMLGGNSVEEVSDMLQATLAPLIGLVGAATGFYFGDRR